MVRYIQKTKEICIYGNKFFVYIQNSTEGELLLNISQVSDKIIGIFYNESYQVM